MEISLGLSGSVPILSLSGRLDSLSSQLLEERVQPLLDGTQTDHVGYRLVVDCSGLSYVSSAGLRVFLLIQRQLVAKGGGVVFASLSKPVLDLFQLAGLHNIFVIEETVSAAAERLS
jgi:anti-anti-sigma factor